MILKSSIITVYFGISYKFRSENTIEQIVRDTNQLILPPGIPPYGIPPSKPVIIGSLNMHYSDATRYSSKAAFRVLLLEYCVPNQ